MNTTSIGPYEEKTRQTVIAVKQRVVYPKKPAIVMPIPPASPRSGLIIASNCREREHRPRYTYNMKLLRDLYDKGESLVAIAEALDVTPSAVSKVVKKMGWTR